MTTNTLVVVRVSREALSNYCVHCFHSMQGVCTLFSQHAGCVYIVFTACRVYKLPCPPSQPAASAGVQVRVPFRVGLVRL